MKQTLITAGFALASVALTYSLVLGHIAERGGMEVPGGIIIYIKDFNE